MNTRVIRPFPSFVSLALGLLCLPAMAQVEGGRWYVSALASHVSADDDRMVDDGFAGGTLALGIPFRKRWNFEAFALYSEFNADGFDRDQKQTGFGVGFVHWYDFGLPFLPYVSVAGGYSDTERAAGTDESAPMGSGAVGALLRFRDFPLALRTEVRYRRVIEDDPLGDLYVSGGLHWSFRERDVDGQGPGRDRPDADGDGVEDSFDLCADSPSGSIVDARGCPEADNDLDGVPNRLDRCPRTPRDIAVNSRGCPADGDRDGVIDALDACPRTPWDSVVDERGCPRGTGQGEGR